MNLIIKLELGSHWQIVCQTNTTAKFTSFIVIVPEKHGGILQTKIKKLGKSVP